ncbi:ArnT family glycosyltransferase [Mucilaginibacter auburnensis]|uniref:4-amino-4-deoxy-L-arabinose transferase-like glycosyltransferase n=1 Tax=Mucilaginibacter auburnensis TaxID=1457233 RepID=A0A2H9VMQ6_9SPHI|nr:glycosyltransferase family 39 protein [Mucilaginibacter auburnensis]PJJ79620.1 4-amino-4-deoxy-L-arabinose transferase-like glycosyltransferase [Mucilaginibacter auburnensis]
MNRANPIIDKQWLYLLIGVAVVINLTGMFIPIMGPDGALYATIAKTMVLRNNYVELFYNGTDWLDKPHFPFWLTAFSFKLFGFTTIAYKLPALLVMLMGAAYTYLFGKRLYNEQIALWAVLILLTAQHIVLSNMDVRAEPYLTGLIIASVYHFYRAQKGNYLQLVLGCLFAACAVMTKGMFALVPICGAIAGHLFITRQWKQLFNLKWLLAFVLILVFIVPELYCLYVQFDAHPEKVVFGTTHVSGIRFFFWDSQFGRFFNTGPIKGHGDPFFFVHTSLWAFLPWSLLLFAAIFQVIKKGIRLPFRTEWYCLSGAMLTFLLFSASSFQLPHYLNIVFPFFAILTAQYLYQLHNRQSIKTVKVTQTIVIILMLLVIAALHYFYQPETFNAVTGVFMLAILGLAFLLPQRVSRGDMAQVVIRTAMISFVINLYINQVFYKSLLKYQAGSEAAMWINQNNPQKLSVIQLTDDITTPFEFYIDGEANTLNTDQLQQVKNKPYILYGNKAIIDELAATGYEVKPLKSFEKYWISRLKPSFLNKATRDKELSEMQVAIVTPK